MSTNFFFTSKIYFDATVKGVES